eukprot:4888872-Lingulodinium_polyedra.AAC.1
MGAPTRSASRPSSRPTRWGRAGSAAPACPALGAICAAQGGPARGCARRPSRATTNGGTRRPPAQT